MSFGFIGDLFPSVDFNKVNLDWILDTLKKDRVDIDKNTEDIEQLKNTTIDYNDLINKPSINGVDLSGNKSLADIGAASDEDVENIKSFIGFPLSKFDARLFSTTHPANWTLVKDVNSITIIHNNTYSSGFPVTPYLDLPLGEYVFHADYTDSLLEFGLYDSDGYVKTLSDGAEFVVTEPNQYKFEFYSTQAQTYVIKDINLYSKEDANSFTIPELSSAISSVSTNTIHNVTETVLMNRAIADNGNIISAGSPNYRVVLYHVVIGSVYTISGSSNWGNLIYAFYDDALTLVKKGTASASGGAFTTISNSSVCCPENASILAIGTNLSSTTATCKTISTLLKGKWFDRKWVCVGDSLTAINSRTTKRYYDYVSERTGINVVNMGYDGSGYARGQGDNVAFYQRISNCPIDADVVTIFGSFNDLGAGLSVGAVDDTGTTTIAGCINTTIDNLQAVIPVVNLGIIAPTPWDTTQPSTSGQAFNYVAMLKAICERRSIPYLDLWRCSNLHPWDATFRSYAYTKDEGSGTHPDETGHRIIASHFENFLDMLLLE